MEYKVEEKSPVERTVTVTVPVDEANAAIGATIAIYRTSADFKGFRKGKAPSQIVESRFRAQIYEEATSDLVNYHLNEILGELGVQPLSRLDVDAGLLKRDEEFVYTVSFEVAPDIDLPQYEGLEVDQEKPEIAAEEIDSVVERIRGNMAEMVKVEEDRTPEDGDVVVISFNAWQDGKAIDEIKAQNFQLVLGEGQSLPQFEDMVKKLKAGEKGEEDVTFPEDFINKDFAGQTVTMRVTLHEIQKKVLPEVNDDFAIKAGGFSDVETMRKAIEHSYLESRKNLVKAAAQKKLMDGLLDGLDFPLPPAMVQEHVERLAQDYVQRLEQQGRRLDATGKTLEDLRAESLPMAEELVRTQLLLLAIATKEGLTVSPEEVDMHIQREAIQTRQDPEAVRRFYEEHNLMFALKDRLLCDKAMEMIYSKAKVNEVERADEAGDKPAKKAPATEAAEPEADGELIMTKGGTPFKTEGAARTRLNSMDGDGEIVEIEGGFAIKPQA
ncbi:trigger factor [Desulfocurvus sp. DL9XJH121]